MNVNENEKMDSALESMTPASTESEVEATVNVSAEAENVNDENEESKAEDVHHFHDMDKEQLLDALSKIVAEKNVEANKEVAAIKAAFFTIRNAEREKEMLEYMEAGNDPMQFSSEPDESENRLKELLTQFKELRAQHLQKIEEERNANLAEKIRIIDALRDIVADIDNINTRFPQFQELQQQFKNVGEVPPGADSETWKSYQIVVEQFYDHLKLNKELRDLDFKKNLEEKRKLIEQAKEINEIEDVQEAFRKLQTLHDAWREIGPVAREIREELWEEFRSLSSAINKRHQDFFLERKAREKENEDAKRALCEEAEAIDIENINSFSGWDEAVKKIIDIQARWKILGFAARKVNNELFARFRATCDKIFEAKNAYYKKIKEEFAQNLEKKTALCERAEALLEKEDQNNILKEVQALQAEWRTIGSVGKKHSDAIWKRFSTACNTFFDRRKKENASRHSEENANLAAKRDIVAKLKEIPLDGDKKDTIGTVRDLQKQWQEIGHVPFKMKDTIYAEYREICDKIYESYDVQENRRRVRGYENRANSLRGEGRAESERSRLQRAFEMKRNELQTYENNMGFFNVKTSAGSSMVKELERKIKKIKDEMAVIQQKIEILDKSENATPEE